MKENTGERNRLDYVLRLVIGGRVKQLREKVEQRVDPQRPKLLYQEYSAPRDLSAEILEHERELVIVRVRRQLLVVVLECHRLGTLGGVGRQRETKLLARRVVVRLCARENRRAVRIE